MKRRILRRNLEQSVCQKEQVSEKPFGEAFSINAGCPGQVEKFTKVHKKECIGAGFWAVRFGVKITSGIGEFFGLSGKAGYLS